MTTTANNTVAIRVWADETDCDTIIVSREEGGSHYTILTTTDHAEALRAARDAAKQYGVDLIDETAQ